MGFVGGDRPEQGYLLPPDVRDWLPRGHLAWALMDLAEGMDLAAFTGWYRADGQGRPAYHPKMMVTLICYCYCKGIRSSRAVEAATFDDVGARVICGNLHPDHSTAARFLGRHEAAVKGLLAASVAACAREGLVSVDVTAGDGTKIRANASMTRNVTAADLNEQIAGLEELAAAEVEAWIKLARAEDAQDTLGLGGDGDDGGSRGGADRGRKRTAATLARRRQALAKLQAAEQARQAEAEAERADRIAHLEARADRAGATAAAMAEAADAKAAAWQARAASGRRPPGPAAVTADDHAHVRRARQAAAAARRKLQAARAAPAADRGKPCKINTTDPSSMVMPAKNGGFGQLHNVQVLAGKRQVIYAIGTHPSPVDVAALHPLLKQGRATLDAAGITGKLQAILFDAGYPSDANFTAPCEGDLHVAVTREARQTGRLKDGKKRETMKDSWRQMAAKLATDQGKALYRQRSGIIEPVFAQLFARLGHHLNYRDDKTDLELHLWAATHNILKAIRARHRAPAPA